MDLELVYERIGNEYVLRCAKKKFTLPFLKFKMGLSVSKVDATFIL